MAVEMHGGTVAAFSEGHGKGSQFVVRLPLAAPAVSSAVVADVPAAKAPKRKILVVDDNRDAARSLAILLGIMGNETRTAHDGLEALELAPDFAPDLVMLDLGMPKLNGYETARRIREQPWGQVMQLVALTGWGQDEDKRKSYEAGFNSHIVKPIEPTALAKLLADIR